MTFFSSGLTDTQYAVNVDPEKNSKKKFQLNEFDCHYLESIIYYLREYYRTAYLPLLRCYASTLKKFQNNIFLFYDETVFPYTITGKTYLPAVCLYDLQNKFPRYHHRDGSTNVFYGSWTYQLICEKLCHDFINEPRHDAMLTLLAKEFKDIGIMKNQNNLLNCCLLAELYYTAMTHLDVNYKKRYDKKVNALLVGFHISFRIIRCYVFLFPNLKSLLHTPALDKFKCFYEIVIKKFNAN